MSTNKGIAVGATDGYVTINAGGKAHATGFIFQLNRETGLFDLFRANVKYVATERAYITKPTGPVLFSGDGPLALTKEIFVEKTGWVQPDSKKPAAIAA